MSSETSETSETPETGSSSSSIMSVAEIIDSAFGLPNKNTVNHKLVQTVLFILASQLRVLGRQVEVIGSPLIPSSSTLSVTEVRLKVSQSSKTILSSVEVSGIKGKVPSSFEGGRLRRTVLKKAMPETVIEEEQSKEIEVIRRQVKESEKGNIGKLVQRQIEIEEEDEKEKERKLKKEKTSGDVSSSSFETSSPKFYSESATEIRPDKISTKQPNKADGSVFDKSLSLNASSGKTSTDKSTSEKTKLSEKSLPDKAAAGKSSLEKKTKPISRDQSYSEESSSDKTATDKASYQAKVSSKPISDKTVTDKQTVDKRSEHRTPLVDKELSATSDDTTSFKTPAEKTSMHQMSTTDKTLIKPYSIEKAPGKPISSSLEPGAEKTSLNRSASQQVPSADKSFLAEKISSKPTASSYNTVVDKTSSGKSTDQRTPTTDTTTLQRTATEKSSVKSSDDTLEETTSVDKTIMAPVSKKKKTTSDPTSSAKTSKGRLDLQLLEALEVKRERLLRIIHQRAESIQEYDKSPVPMASLDSIEAEYEKLLVVERVSSEEARERAKAARKGQAETPKLSIVTQEEFDALALTVRQIQEKYKEIGKLELPENLELMHELRKGASLTDAMGALQLSARLEAAEKTLQNMMDVVSELASKTPGVNLTAADDMEIFYNAKLKSPATMDDYGARPTMEHDYGARSTMEHDYGARSTMDTLTDRISTTTTAETEQGGVTYIDLEDALQKLRDQIMGAVEENKIKNTTCSERVLRHVTTLEGKLNAALKLDNRMNDVETLVAQYAEKINALDSGLSTQMTNYQEELTQMQHDLETGLDNMAEVLANAGTDTTAVSELNTHFSNLQADIENTMYLQKELQDTQELFQYDLSNLRQQIESLRDDKSDRDEVADALRDKAGLGDLNGLVTWDQFNAVRGDFEKRIIIAYEKFNNQETHWQKTIDDLLKDLNDKADIVQVKSLEEEVNKHLITLTAKLNAMMEIVGEPKASAVSKKLHRDEACLSCATPAQLESKAPKVPALPGLRPPAIGAEAPRPGGQGDHNLCYPGKPIPHPIDPRAHICKRWCGGSHTIPTGLTKAPAGITTSTLVRDTTTTVGTDGKVYQTDERHKKPCKPCFTSPPPQAEPELAKEAEDAEPNLPSTPMDVSQCLPMYCHCFDVISYR